jgi:hypothetical protein
VNTAGAASRICSFVIKSVFVKSTITFIIYFYYTVNIRTLPG